MNIKKKIKQDGSIVYTTQLYLGTDSFTDKKVRTSITGKTQREVKAKIKQKQIEFENSGRTITNKQTVIKTFGELFLLWWETYKPSVKPQTLKQTRSVFKNFILPNFENMPLNKMTTPLIQQQVNECSKVSNKYNLLKSYTSNVLAYGVSLGVIPYNPARDVILPKVKKEKSKKIKFLTLEQVQQFYSYQDNLDLSKFKNRYDYTLYKLALATGCRIGELIALNWSDIDLENGTVSVNKTYNASLRMTSTPKTETSRRNIPIDNKTVLIMKQFKNAQHVAHQGRKLETVFFYGVSKYPTPFGLQYRLDNHLKKANLPRITFHAFRHTHASLLLNNGIDFKTLQDRLGHSDIKMTMNIYSHLSDDKKKTAVSIFENAINF